MDFRLCYHLSVYYEIKYWFLLLWPSVCISSLSNKRSKDKMTKNAVRHTVYFTLCSPPVQLSCCLSPFESSGIAMTSNFFNCHTNECDKCAQWSNRKRTLTNEFDDYLRGSTRNAARIKLGLCFCLSTEMLLSSLRSDKTKSILSVTNSARFSRIPQIYMSCSKNIQLFNLNFHQLPGIMASDLVNTWYCDTGTGRNSWTRHNWFTKSKMKTQRKQLLKKKTIKCALSSRRCWTCSQPKPMHDYFKWNWGERINSIRTHESVSFRFALSNNNNFAAIATVNASSVLFQSLFWIHFMLFKPATQRYAIII